MRTDTCIRNPFSIGVVQSDADFCNRVKEKAELVQHAVNRNKVVLYSPRRYGKSSIVGRVQDELRKAGFLTVYADLFSVVSEQDFFVRIANALYHGLGNGITPKNFLDRAKEFFRMLTVEVTHEGYKVYPRADSSSPTIQQVEDLLAGLQSYVQKHNIRLNVCFDEFQEITGLPEAKKLEGILRAHIQQHRDISYFFVGSRRRILQDMFSNRSRPFYKIAFSKELEEIAAEEFVPFVMEKFSASGKTCPKEHAEEIFRLVRGYPYYVQKLSSFVWDLTDQTVDLMIVQEAYKRLIKAEEMDFVGVWSGLSLNQKKLLRAIAEEPTNAPYGKDFIAKYDLSIGGAQGALKVLLDQDIVEQVGPEEKKLYRVTDPVLGVWSKAV